MQGSNFCLLKKTDHIFVDIGSRNLFLKLWINFAWHIFFVWNQVILKLCLKKPIAVKADFWYLLNHISPLHFEILVFAHSYFEISHFALHNRQSNFINY